ncbi:hypothetical protein RCV51_01145 [Truepera radiovictrix]|nr:hypothetical protein [Truepera radiovictrix]WMT57564.1 hypothetical protein RCV51_01145 [Truepera radiovictrix]
MCACHVSERVVDEAGEVDIRCNPQLRYKRLQRPSLPTLTKDDEAHWAFAAHLGERADEGREVFLWSEASYTQDDRGFSLVKPRVLEWRARFFLERVGDYGIVDGEDAL